MKSKLDVIKAANPVLEIQFNLRDISKRTPEIPIVLPTGTYDSQTRAAVIEFQKFFNIPVTGTVDYLTWNTINKEHRNCMHCLNSPSKVCCFPDNVYEYRKGVSENVIYVLQIILNNFHRKYKNYPDILITGLFDEQTEEALKMFQEFSHLPVTGVLDRRTWNTLNKINEACKMCE